jgi:hypothetical protein
MLNLTPLLPFFQWCDESFIGAYIRSKTWVFPIIETIHILALTILFGTVFLLDLRLMNAGLRRQPIALLSKTLLPYTETSIVIILLTGFSLFLSEALKCYGNAGFQLKMVFLGLALIFHYALFRRLAQSDKRMEAYPILAKMAAVISMFLWFGVGVGGRAIGFV